MSTTENNGASNAPNSTPAPVAASSGGNQMLTYLLYALLAGLVCLLGYRAVKLKNEKTAALKAEAEYQQLLTETGYAADDSTSGVAKTGDVTSPTDSKPLNLTEPNATNGIAAAAEKTLAAGAKTVEKAVESTTKTSARTVATDSDDEEIAAVGSAKARLGGDKKRSPVTYSSRSTSGSKAPYLVVAASFSNKDGARKVMESLVKKGFENAEVTNNFRNKKYWYVIADRAKTDADAKKVAAEVAKIKDCEKAYVSKIK